MRALACFRRRFRPDESGVSTLEATIVLPFVLVLGLGTIEFGWLMSQIDGVQTGLSGGVRYASRAQLAVVNRTNCSVAALSAADSNTALGIVQTAYQANGLTPIVLTITPQGLTNSYGLTRNGTCVYRIIGETRFQPATAGLLSLINISLPEITLHYEARHVGARHVPKLRGNQSGVAMLEFTLVAPLFFFAVFGIIEFGLYFWQLGAINKGGQWALRYAVVSDPVTGDAAALTPNSGKVFTCRSQGSGTATCTPSTNAPDAHAMGCIVEKVKAFAPFVEYRNVVVEYRANSLGVGGFQAPTIQIKLENVEFMTIFLGFMGGQVLPTQYYTSTGEDMSSMKPQEAGPSSKCGKLP